MRIWKFKLNRNEDGGEWLELPEGAKFLHAASLERNEISLWFELDPNAPMERRLFYVVATGQAVPNDAGYKWLCTVIEKGVWVWHIYERMEL